MNAKKKALGRGLNALLGDSEIGNAQYETFVFATPKIPIDSIVINPRQPRTDFELQSLEELAKSISNLGIIQPVTVKVIENDKYQLISGERRLRAAKMAGLNEIPAYIREADDNELLEIALVENIQRENLNAIEIAHSFQRLIEECEITQDQLSEKVGKNRTTITNYLRLLKLPAEIQVGIRDNMVTMGHARSLINISDKKAQLSLYAKILEKGLSVRQVEEIVRNLSLNKNIKPEPKHTLISKDIHSWKKSFGEKLNSKVSIKISDSGKGNISISFKNTEHLKEIIRLIQ